MTAISELRCIADLLAEFGTQWSRAATAMSRGEFAGIGKPEDIAKLAPLLLTRAAMLQKLSKQIRANGAEIDVQGKWH